MSKVVVKVNYAEVGKLLKSSEMSSMLAQIGNTVAGNAGTGFEAAAPHNTGQRLAVNVYPATKEAAKKNAENNTLLCALHI